MRCKQRASSFDKSTVFGCENFLLKIDSEMIFTNALFCSSNNFRQSKFSHVIEKLKAIIFLIKQPVKLTKA